MSENNMKHFEVDFKIFSELCYTVLNKVTATEKKYNAILCPLKGGFYLSYFMSKHLSLPLVYLEISSYSGKEQIIFTIGLRPQLEEGLFLLCDDIYDSGNTVKKIHSLYPQAKFDMAFLISKKMSNDLIYGKYVENEWVDFFWEVM